MKKIITLLVVVAFLSIPSFGYAMAEWSTADVQMLSDGSVVKEDGSRLIRTRSGITATLRSSELPVGHVLTMWWVVFNNPEECTGGTSGLRCGETDLASPTVDASVAYAAGTIVGGSGKASFGAHRAVGNLNKVYLGNGLTNPEGADVHLVVRDHGPIETTLLHEMLTTFGANCTPETDPFGIDTDGDYACADLQFAAHEQW